MNTVTAFFLYMWNRWSEDECRIAFADSHCGWRHLWDKWEGCNKKGNRFGGVEEFYAELDDRNRELLVSRACYIYNKV